MSWVVVSQPILSKRHLRVLTCWNMAWETLFVKIEEDDGISSIEYTCFVLSIPLLFLSNGQILKSNEIESRVLYLSLLFAVLAINQWSSARLDLQAWRGGGMQELIRREGGGWCGLRVVYSSDEWVTHCVGNNRRSFLRRQLCNTYAFWLRGILWELEKCLDPALACESWVVTPTLSLTRQRMLHENTFKHNSQLLNWDEPHLPVRLPEMAFLIKSSLPIESTWDELSMHKIWTILMQCKPLRLEWGIF